MWIKLWANKSHTIGQFKCCPSRGEMDKAIDGWSDEYSSELGKPWSRDVKCTIGGMMSCEECGSKCDSCGVQC
jgi:hypothetical protein